MYDGRLRASSPALAMYWPSIPMQPIAPPAGVGMRAPHPAH